MGKILMMHHIDAPHHARLLQRDDCQAARLLVLAAGAVGDDGNAQILRDKLLDGGDTVHLDDDIEVPDIRPAFGQITFKHRARARSLGTHDEPLALQCADGDAGTPCQRVDGRHHKAQVIGIQQHFGVAGCRELPVHDGYVQARRSASYHKDFLWCP